MRISDWSSDVCSSDLLRRDDLLRAVQPGSRATQRQSSWAGVESVRPRQIKTLDPLRSEERRVGKECVSTCRSRWSTYHSKKKIIKSFTMSRTPLQPYTISTLLHYYNTVESCKL